MFLASCTEKGKIFDQMKEISPNGWTYNQIPEFPVQIDNNKLTYDIYLKLRVQKSYKYENLYLLSHIREPGGRIQTRQIDITLTDDLGRPLGNTSGDAIDYEVPMYKQLHLKNIGQYTIALEQNLRDSVLTGVESIGIKVKEGVPVF